MPLDFGRNSEDPRLRRRAPPNYLGRSTQYRIFALLASLFLVVFLMEQAGKPENWRWIWTIGENRAPVDGDVDTRLRPAAGSRIEGTVAEPLLVRPTVDAAAESAQPAAQAPGPPRHRDPPRDRAVSPAGAASATDSRTGRPSPARPSPSPPSSPDAASALAAPSEPTSDFVSPVADEAMLRAQCDVWSRLLDSLDDHRRDEFLAGLKAARDGQARPTEAATAWTEIIRQLDAGWQDYVNKAFLTVQQDGGQLTDREKRDWLHVIDTLKRDWRDRLEPTFRAMGAGRPLEPVQAAAIDNVQAVLDRVFLESIRDNTVFRGAEKDAWFRMLEQLDRREPSDLQRASTGYVGFLQLYKQPEAYRGKLVTIKGSVRMGYYRTAPDNLYGIPGYYVFWVKPVGSKSPIVVYSLEIPSGFPDVAKLERDGERPRLDEDVEFTGFFFKRWAYRAQDDTRLAPLVLAKTPRWERPPGAAADRPPSAWFWFAVFGGAAGFGFGLAAVFFWLTRRSPVSEMPARLDFLEPTDATS